jgi:hypothetical protein
MKVILRALGPIWLVAAFATGSMAQNARTFVSGAGLDTNPCSLTSPCRTFGQAVSVTNAGGEVVVLTSAGYGPFTINKAVTLEAPAGVYAGISVTSGDGIDVNAGSMDTVILRGLTVNNQGSSGNGIVFNTVGTVHIERCIANGFSRGDGIVINGPGNIFVTDTIARGNLNGMLVQPETAGTASVTMDQVHLDANSYVGLFLNALVSGALVNGAIRNSTASGNGTYGVVAQGTLGVASLDIESCLITNNTTGILSTSTGTGAVSISNCTISRNSAAGFNIQPDAAIFSRGNNTITGNGPNGMSNSGTLTALPAQ